MSLSPLVEPPPGPPWDVPLEQAPLVFFDLEMTGLDPERDAIIELAMVRQLGGRIVSDFSSLVAPDRPIDARALALHGIDPGHLAQAPSFAALAPRVVELLSAAVPIAHGADRDVCFLRRALERSGHDPSLLTFFVDTLHLARRALAAPRYSLRELCRVVGLPPRRWHRAREDVEALMALFPYLVRELAPVSARDLWEVRVGQRGIIRVRSAIAHRLDQLVQSHTPCTVVTRTRNHPPQAYRGVIERWNSPHVYLRLTTPEDGTKVIRADRILRIEDGR